MRQDVQSLILMPEIALTAQFLDRFAARFGVRPALWHSGIGARRRERLHAGIAAGEVKVVAGARSALFLPFARLGLVVVDEEHEAAYKQEDGVCYHARDLAVVRGRLEDAPVDPRLGDALDRDPRQRRPRALQARLRCRSASAAAPCRRSARSTSRSDAAAARALALRNAAPGDHRYARREASRCCCS